MSLLAKIQSFIASGHTVEEAEAKALIEASPAPVFAPVFAPVAPVVVQRSRFVTPEMLAHIGLRNGMSDAEVQAKIDAAYPPETGV